MIIKTITCHDVYNYGASLQAYALQQYLNAAGHRVEIIDYKPLYLRRKYNFWHIYTSNPIAKFCNKFFILKFVYCLIYAPVRYKTWKRIGAFNRFTKSNLHRTKRYDSFEQLKKDPPVANVYIAGSDQIWNTNLPNGHDGAFFLQFGSPQIKRIAYAASFGVQNITNQKSITTYLKDFALITVREKSAVKIVDGLGYSSVRVCDPVFLLSKDEWGILTADSRIQISEPYILVYDIFARDLQIKDFVLEYAKIKRLKVIAVNDSKPVMYADQNIKNAGPIEFLWLIKNAQIVISNSFHATAFSVIFSRPLAVIFNGANSSRMSDFLDEVGLLNLFNPQLSDVLMLDINWKQVTDRLEPIIKESKQTLNLGLCQL